MTGTEMCARPGRAAPPGRGSGRRSSERRSPGEDGLWVFLLGDMAVFALLFGTVVVLRGRQTEMFREAQGHLHPTLGIVNTVLLLTGSLAVVLALRAARAGAGRAAAQLLAGATAGGVGFAVVKVIEYTGLLAAGLNPETNEFFMYYFVITGVHLGHLVIGVVLLVVLGLRLRRVRTATRVPRTFAECAACYWHMVDLLWLVLFPLLYLVR